MPDVVNESIWWIGWVAGAGVVVVVVAVVLTIIALARSIRATVLQIVRGLANAKDHTEALWRVETTIRAGRDALTAVRRARGSEG